MTKLIANLKKKSGIDKLERREKKFVLAGLLFVAFFMLIQVVILPYLHARSALSNSVERREAEIVDMKLLSQEYRSLNSRKDTITRLLGKRSPDFSLFSFLEEQAAVVEVKERVTYMKPSKNEIEGKLSELIVEMKLEKISLTQLVELLKKIELKEKVVMVRKMIVQESSQQHGGLDIILNVRTFELNDR